MAFEMYSYTGIKERYDGTGLHEHSASQLRLNLVIVQDMGYFLIKGYCRIWSHSNRYLKLRPGSRRMHV